MEISKAMSKSLIKADATADIELINQYALKELKPEDVFCFSVVLCDNDVDRDYEYFTPDTLKKLAPMFVGKTGISDHNWSADNQISRIYRTAVVETTEKTALNEPLMQLTASVYILRTDATKSVIESIEGGILKEVSIFCRVKQCNCSVCGKTLRFDWDTWSVCCENGHEKGETYDGKICAGALEQPADAYEFSFVAVPAQKRAGVTKSAEDCKEAVKTLLEADISKSVEHSDFLRLLKKFRAAMTDHDEMALRAKILKENEQFLTK